MIIESCFNVVYFFFNIYAGTQVLRMQVFRCSGNLLSKYFFNVPSVPLFQIILTFHAETFEPRNAK